MNAVLQAILSFDCFVADLQSNTEVLQPLLSENTSISTLLLDVARKMRRTNHGVIDLKLLKNAIDRNLKAFSGWTQQVILLGRRSSSITAANHSYVC